jgi:UDP:flavonoid glycosyltransferase YjiC (YdhE family)
MHALLMPLGSSGDVHPFVGLGVALKGRGHYVTVVTNGHFRAPVEREGLDFVENGTAAEYLEAMRHPDLWHPIRGFKAVVNHPAMPAALRRQYELVRGLATPGQAVVVAGSLALGARIAREVTTVPLVTVHLQPSLFRSVVAPPVLGPVKLPGWLPRGTVRFLWWLADRAVLDPVAAATVEPLRRELGLPPASRYLNGWWDSPDRVIGLFPDWFAHAPDWPPQARLTGFPLFDERTAAGLSPEVQRFLDAGEPPVVATFGSGMQQGAPYFATAADALGRLGRRGLLLTPFREQVPGRLPPGVAHFAYVPFSQVLPRAAALVHHGGIGTSAQGLAAGVPQVVMPLAHDQPDNADRLRRLGVSRTLPPKRFRGPALAAALDGLLHSERTAKACREVAARFRGTDPVGDTCRLIEELAGREGKCRS